MVSTVVIFGAIYGVTVYVTIYHSDASRRRSLALTIDPGTNPGINISSTIDSVPLYGL
jgi:hypothetical protein